MAGISDFLGALTGGGARPNRFECIIDFPAFAGGSEEIRKTAFLVMSTSLPGSTLGTIEHPFRGRQVKLAGDRTFDEWSVTFVNDTDFAIYNAFERWHNAINAFNSNTGFQAPAEYMSTVTVYQLDNQDNRIKEKVMKFAWPVSIGPIELGQDSNDVLESFEISFAYSDVQTNSTT